MSARRRQRGVGLLEILIAVVIISIGFLAAARMQVESMRNSQSSYYRSQAYFMASAMVDRMRANVEGVRDGFYDDKTTAEAVSDPACEANACTPERIAQQDLHDWRASLHAGGEGFIPLLPSVEGVSAAGSVSAENGTGRYTVKLVWGEIVGGKSESSELTVQFVPER